MLCHFGSGYFGFGQDRSRCAILVFVRPGQARLGQVTSYLVNLERFMSGYYSLSQVMCGYDVLCQVT